MKQVKVFSSAILLFLLLSCNKEKTFDCIKTSGEIREETRALPPFNEIMLRDGVDLVFVPDTEQKVLVKAGKNLIPKIYTSVIDGRLTIENQNYCNWVRSYEKELAVYIHHDTSSLKLYHKGFGTIQGKVQSRKMKMYYFANESSDMEFDSDYLWLEMYHLGNVSLRGRITEVAAFRHETGQVQASTLDAKIFLINDHGQGESHIRATEHATVNILGSGNVVVHGNPDVVTVMKEGTGQVIVK